jgi:hypothetical protein
METNNTLFVVGAHKTATSTLVGMLNCHPDIFILYETELYQPHITRHGKRFLTQYPDARFLFRSSEDPSFLYSQLRCFLGAKGYQYNYVGDKLPGLDATLLGTLSTFKVIFTVRDIRTWLCKNSIVRKYITEHDVVPPAIDYCTCFLSSFKLPDVFHVRMEDLIASNEKLIEEMGGFLRLDLDGYLQTWWDKIEITDKNDPKASNQWWESHHSSLLSPRKGDTVAQVSNHPFLEKLLPIFDKYYEGVGTKFDKSEIDEDVEQLRRLKDFSPVPVEDAFCFVESHSISEVQRNMGVKKKLKKSLNFLRMKRSLFL